ncbi:germ cell nuclear acidic protein isoform X1 [Haemorhous mexicanus]|uniref:germ cell nuclear acidic protein isoform X1 n=1 Tax=Haemorhous mexicanus TaxID=30427 RepID=UPI0028BE5400|nr:germ cell nuclear acidic protein isoform X1 [Haemorhous mexicanus]
MAGAAGPGPGPEPEPTPGPRPREWPDRAGSGAGTRRAASGASATSQRSPERGAAGSQGWRSGSSALYLSSSSDDEFEMFLARLKTPKSVPKKADTSLKDFIDDSDDFFLDLKVKKSTTKSARKDLQTPKKLMTPGKRNTCCQELQYPDTSSDTEDSVFVDSPWHNHQKKGVKDLRESQKCINLSPPQNQNESVFKGSPDLLVRRKERSCEDTENKLPTVALGRSAGVESDSSDESFGSLMERIKKRSLPRKPVLSTSKTVFQPSTTENVKPPCKNAQPVKGEGGKTPKPKSISLQETPSMVTTPKPKTPKPKSISLQETPSMVTTPARISENESVSCSQSAKTEKRFRVCSVPDCFLQDLSNPASHYVKYFKKNKEELAQKLYRLFNSTIFEQKLPEDMVIIWNKKMRKTAGYCVTGQRGGPEGKRYARIELSEKVCDSADRLRDTLIHEVCHAATWLISGVRDGHGRFWRFYANKAAVIHPELPVVTRCHSYEINYKFTYECGRCKATIGRHSRSLDTARFVCAFCGGQLALRQPPARGGTPARTQLTPFAKYVKENYALAKREQHGLSHAEVMKKLSADFAVKTKLEDSF